MADSTSSTYLGYTTKATSTTGPLEFTIACDIIDYPDLTSPAERIEVTTLSDKARKYIKGIADQAEQTYTANYDREQYNIISDFGDDEKCWAILFLNEEGDSSVFWFNGQSHISVAGGGVGDVRKMNITLYANTDVKLHTRTNWELSEEGEKKYFASQS